MLPGSLPFGGGGGGHRRHGACLQAPMGARELRARGRASWRRKKPRLLRAAAVLELSEVADSTSALSECFKVFLSIE